MKKTYCDVCDVEIKRNYASERLKIKRGPFTAEVMIYHGDVCNAGDLCRVCVSEILNEGKEINK